MRYTDHDLDIVFGGQTFAAASGFDVSALESAASFAAGNADIAGILSADEITAADLRGGVYDGATVKIALVNWASPSDGEIILKEGYVGEITMTDDGTFVAAFVSKLARLDQGITQTYQATCRADLGDSACSIPLRPAVLGRSAAVAIGEYYRVATLSPTSPRIWDNLAQNPTFEIGTTGVITGAGDGSALTGWIIPTGIEFALRDTYSGLSAYDHTQYLMGGSAGDGECYQDVDLLNAGLLAADIDAGNARVNQFAVYRANNAASDKGRVLVEFLDSSKTVISTCYDSGEEVITPTGTWFFRGVALKAVPANTRYIRIRLMVFLYSGSEINSCFDKVELAVQVTSAAFSSQRLYENRIYEVTTAGTTAGTQPTYDTTVGNTTTDGTAVLTCRDSWMRDAEVETVIDGENFTIRVEEDRAVTGWFDSGAIVFETGPTNLANAFEVKTWTLSWSGSPEVGQIELYRATPQTVYPGQQLRLYRGCDKKLATCGDTFANDINFRGEPYIPGGDSLMTTGPQTI